MSEQAGEKTHAPSEKRRQDAARKGDVLRSRELATAATVLVGAIWLKLAGPWLMAAMGDGLRAGFTFDRAALDHFSPGPVLFAVLKLAAPPVLLLGLVVIAASLVAQLGVGGDGRWVGSNVLPKASRLNPASGLARMFGPTGWIEIGKGLAKVSLLGAIAWAWAGGRIAVLLGLGQVTFAGQLAYAWDAITSLLFALAAGLVLIALVDFPIQWWRRMSRLRMTQQELRDEHKESEGNPENKAAQRQRQRQIAMGGVAHAMREAQFVITNPTHFAVAMAYDPEKAHAPIVLAKGRGDKALAMRELAAELDLPCLEYPALARSVFYTTRERQVIREELFSAVAAVLAFVFSLKRGEAREAPQIDVPAALRFDADGRRDPAAKG